MDTIKLYKYMKNGEWILLKTFKKDEESMVLETIVNDPANGTSNYRVISSSYSTKTIRICNKF